MAHVDAALKDSRLVTLVGTGGCGKTRLALEVAAQELERFGDGVWFVDLAALDDAALVPMAVLGVLSLVETTGRSPVAVLEQRLRTRDLLLVLDNCEHLIEASAELVSTLLQAGPRIRVLATSREPLGVPGERLHQVRSLASPEPGSSLSLEQLTEYPAVELFVARAQLVQSEFVLTAANGKDVANVCHRLDGIPLAIELAAARLRVLTLDQIQARLDDRFRLLVAGSRISLPRQRTLAATLDWSYELLAPAERAVLLRLPVFAGG